jgi:hypothetical protein
MATNRRVIQDPSQKSETLSAWRQVNYVTRQPIGMLLYNLWYNDKAHFEAVFLKLPKKEIVEAFQYLNVDYHLHLDSALN